MPVASHLNWRWKLSAENRAGERMALQSCRTLIGEVPKEHLLRHSWGKKAGSLRFVRPPELRNLDRQAERFVALMWHRKKKHIQSAFECRGEGWVAGRCSDVAIIAALPVLEGISEARRFSRRGKILECELGCCCTALLFGLHGGRTRSRTGFSRAAESHFFVHSAKCPMPPSLYENADPYHLVESGWRG